MTDEIKLYRPQRLSDNPDGGGLATSIEIVDGQINNLFDDADRIDRVNGSVSLRKFIAVADTEDASTFLGLHFIAKAPPLDPNVSAFIFRTPGWADERAVAQNVVERYLDPSVPTRMIPFDRQLAGQRALLVFQRPNLALPEIGEVYVLADQAGTQFEFVRVADIAHREETFTDSQGDYQVRVITLTLTQPLQQQWPGSQPNRRFELQVPAGATPAGSVLRASSVSDAARYYGTVPLALDADSGALTIKVGTVYGQLIPAAITESPVLNAPAGGGSAFLPAGSASTLAMGTATALSTAGRFVFPRALAFPLVIVSNFGDVYTELPGGAFSASEGATAWADLRLDADRSTLNWASSTAGARKLEAQFVPAVLVQSATLSANVPVTLGTRGSVYVANLTPAPGPGSVSVSYRALGRWYTLQDDGQGVLSSSPGIGIGTINYATGALSVTLGALPDVGSSLIYAWSEVATYQIRTQSLGGQVPEVSLQLDAGVEPGTLSIEWEAGGDAKAASDNGAGVLTGDASGSVQYGSGLVQLRPTVLPNSDATFEAEYESAAVVTEIFNPTKSGSTITITAAGAIRERSVLITHGQTMSSGPLQISTTQQLTDNGLGQLVDAGGNIKPGSSVNYSTGAITFNPDYTADTPTLSYSDFSQGLPARLADPTTGYFAAQAQFGLWPAGVQNTGTSIGFIDGSAVVLQYKPAGASDAVRTQSFDAPPVRVRMNRGTSNAIVPGSLQFQLGGERFIDRAGRLVRSPSAVNGVGVDAGTISYSTGVAELTSYPGNVAPALTVEALLTQVRPLPLSVATGRTPGAPIRPGSFILQANRYGDGVQITAAADQNGNLSTADMHGYIDVNTGVWSVAFGRWKLASALAADELAAPWYSVDAVNEDGYIWRPEEAQPGSVRFSCVVQTSLPLDPAIIGVNPVRLPLDGRVQVIRAGDTLVIHDTQAFALPNPVEAGETYALPRTGLASAVIYAANGLGVPSDRFTVDRTAGTVTMEDPLDLTGYTQPLTVLHTVEDMALCTDAQIDGTVSIAQPLTRGYDADNALVSSALVVGDVAARVANVFSQNTWTNVWSDALIGSAPGSGAAYNTVSHPIEVINANTITQRWRLQFTSATAYNVVGEQLGVLTTGTTAADLSVNNPATGQPYFVIRAAGWGSGWATGNVLRFNTIAAGSPVWAGRTVRPGAAVVLDDRIRIEARYDRD
jgi:hypothetical protein